MIPVILFRESLAERDEIKIAKKYFKVITTRSKIHQGNLIIPRYSALPYYKELEEDALNLGGELINTYKQHKFVANLENWYEELQEFTPETWFDMTSVPHDAGPFVLKGETNSKKHLWNTHMFAKDKVEAINVMVNLQNDGLVGDQRIYIRKYIPLMKIMDGFNGLPISNEFRFFVLDGKVISKGFYWSNVYDDLPNIPDVNSVPEEFINTVINKVKDKIRFFVLDVAQKEDGGWIVVELNDGSMSGLSMNEPDELYKNMLSILEQGRNVKKKLYKIDFKSDLLVVAESEKRAVEIVLNNEIDFDNEFKLDGICEIKSYEEIPAEWRRSLPYTENNEEISYEDILG